MRSLLRVATLGLLTIALLGAKPQRHDVAMKSMAFSPASLSIHVGDTVLWTNNDDRDHSVTANDGSFKSGTIAAGETFEHQFTKAGTFSYSCSYHPRMKGTITVSQ